ncbi:MAG: CopG family transcriptional regulator [Akkermansiaceae bacterium]|nr:CopG family transcriptional regulator [Akkermansiaceae bacterium]
MKRPPRSRHPVPGDSVTRISVSISAEDKAALEKIAEERRVSLAWVLRDAVTKYLKSDQSGE